MYPLTLAWRMKARRKMLGMTQGAVAKATGMTQAAICQLEIGTVDNPTHHNRRALCDALHCHYKWLFDGDISYAPAGFYTPAYDHPGHN